MERAPVLVWRWKSPSGSPAGVHEADEKKKKLKNLCGLSVKRRQGSEASVPTLHLSQSLNVLQRGTCNVLYLT